MPLENATTLSGLDSTWPLGLDSASRGDDHLRLLKAVLKAQFPGAGGQGFSKPITVTEDQLNALPQHVADITGKMFPVGTVVFRMDNKNPATIYGGTWSLITGDATITFGNGAAQTGGVTGSNDVAVPLPAHTHNATFVGDRLPDHRHDNGIYGESEGTTNRRSPAVYKNDGILYTGYASAGTPSGSVTVSSAGVSNPTINVRGARIAINVWQRTAL